MKQTSTAVQKVLLSWYLVNARDLPWRRTKDPYAIWISEIMLQQTQVQTVVDYYTQWLKKFPTLKSLAQAEIHEVLALWAGLGYYRRARMLHAAAKEVYEKHDGTLPNTVEELIKLPGIGRYTAGAIASIAFNHPAPILDGNVIRILSRIYTLKEDVSEGATLKKLWKLAEDMICEKNPGDLNQAMMELGATVCLPANPRCRECPVANFCGAHITGKETSYPVKKEKEKLEKIETFALVLHSNGKVLLRQQPEYGRWGGLWMFPFWQSESLMIEENGLKKSGLTPLMTLEHGFTKYRITLRVYEYLLDKGRGLKKTPLQAREGSLDSWVDLQSLGKYAFPSPHKKILKEITRKYDAAIPT